MASTNFLSKDGLLNVEEIVLLAREIDKLAVKEQLKPAEIHFSGKVIPKYDAAKAKAGGEAFEKKRSIPIKVRSRMPASGSRVKMVALLRNYKGLEEFTEFTADFNAAVKAIAAHNKIAERFIAKNKAEGAKKRAAATKEFDKNVDAFMDLLDAAGIDEDNVAIGTSMMGKTIIVKLPNGGYVSVGKADKERFLKAQESADADAAAPAKKAPARGTARTSTRAAKAAPVAKTSTRTARSTRTAAAESKTERVSRRAATDKVVKKVATRSAGAAKPVARKPVATAKKPGRR